MVKIKLCRWNLSLCDATDVVRKPNKSRMTFIPTEKHTILKTAEGESKHMRLNSPYMYMYY